MSSIAVLKAHLDPEKNVFWTMLAFGWIGLIVSFILSVEEFHLLKEPDAVLSCTINLVLNCATVMKTWQASVFGFPNMFIGLMGFAVVITVATVMVAGGKVQLSKWFWRTATICYGLGLLFSYWLFFQSVYVIEVLCPWCLVITATTTIIFATMKHYALRENVFDHAKSTHQRFLSYLAKGYDKLFVAGWLVFLAALVIMKFGESLFA